MKIYDFSPFYNENFVTSIKTEEHSSWVDEFHIIETNRTFQNVLKEYNYSIKESNLVKYHKIDVTSEFISDSLFKKIKRKIRFLTGCTDSVEFGKCYVEQAAWLNEAYQRNYASLIIDKINLQDDDILIFSDVDEIIDSRNKDIIIEKVKKHGIVTGKLHFTMFYLNLFVQNWGGAPDYSYRTFIMTGEYYKKMNVTLDMLRKAGERGKLEGIVYCMDEFIGFHHSWLGDSDFVQNKIMAYAHTEHKQFNTKDYLNNCIKNGKSFIPNVILEKDINVKLLNSIDINSNKEYLFE
jgi:hypothetical protein